MGNHQSKNTSSAEAAAAQEKQLVDRLKALQRSRSEGGLRETYQHRRQQPGMMSSTTIGAVSEKQQPTATGRDRSGSSSSGTAVVAGARKPEGIAVSQMEEWQSVVLKEPRYK